MPSSSRTSSPSEVKGTGVLSQAVGSSVAACGAAGRGCQAPGPRRERPPAGRRWWRFGWRLSAVLEFKRFWLACPEGDDAPDGIVRRHADGHAISGDDLDAEAAHAAAQLGQDLVAGVALHAVQPAAVDRYDSALHVNEIVLAQTASVPFLLNNYCATSAENTQFNHLGISSFSH